MFRKRVKKPFPPGTFLPNPARIFAIIQLCMAFTLIAWYGSQPFMGKHFAIKSRLLVFESLFSDPNYSTLSTSQKYELENRYDLFRKKMESSFWMNTKQSFRIICLDIPPFQRAWLLLSVIIPVYLLKKKEGAWQAAWLLPLLILLYAFDNQWQGTSRITTEEEKLYPSESRIMTEYVREPMNPNILIQREQLLQGWQLYIIKEWAKEEPNEDKDEFKDQYKRGEFAFTVARANKLTLPEDFNFRSKKSILLLSLYLLWNVLFASIFLKQRHLFCVT